jgi:DNA-binding response OmpR family regulator
MSRSTVFADRHARRSRVTTLTDEEHLFEILAQALDRAGFDPESAEEGADTPYDLAATSPDLVIIGFAAAADPGGLQVLVRELVDHPHLRHVPVIVCGPSELVAVPMELPEHAAVRMVSRPARDEELAAVVGRLTLSLIEGDRPAPGGAASAGDPGEAPRSG